MTKEQEEAIERLNRFKTVSVLYSKTLAIPVKNLKELQVNIETVLNMLKENSAEIEQKNTELAEKSAEIEKKDKEIDLILDKLNENYTDVFKNNEVKGIIEIYEKIKNTSNLSGIKLRKECIKQYFERKVEE